MRLQFLILALLARASASPCSGSNRTTYMRSEGMRLMEFSTHSLNEVTLNTCADACTTEANGHACASFEYDSRSQECAMHVEDGQPLGPSVLARTDTPIAFFQQICVKDEFLCPTPFAFERYPQSILMGHAMQVSSTDGLSNCLSLCLSSQSTISSPCASLMYFYETGECILNRETKADQPHLFREGVQETLVDYFENTCMDVECTHGVLHWLRSEDFNISPEKDVIVESMSLDECKALCASNSIADERFPCRSFVYSESKQHCHLSADSGYSCRKRKSFNLNPISSGQYFQKFCLNSSVSCLDSSFEQVPNRKMTTEPYRVVETPSIHQCLSICIDDGANCASATFDYEKDNCLLFGSSQFSNPDHFKTDNRTDYFDKICDTVPLKQSEIRPSANAAPRLETEVVDPDIVDQDLTQPSIDPTSPVISEDLIGQTEAAVEETVIDDSEDFLDSEATAVKARLSSECRMSGVTVTVDFGDTTTGAVYIKDHFSTCRAEFIESTHVALHIPFPRSDENNPRCPGIEMSPAHWSFMVVVQKNEMSSPSLVTSTDRVFNVTCDYTELVEKVSQPGLRYHYEESKDPYGEELKSDRIKMEILRNGKPVTVVPLGDHVELRWTILNPEAGLGFFVNECVALRVGGTSPEPEPLKIIYQGCPEDRVRNRLLDSPIEHIENGYSTRMKVFRFDGSRRVRIKCSIDVCVDRCPSVICSGLDSGRRESFGRKRRQTMQDLAGMLGRFRPDFSLPQTSPSPETTTIAGNLKSKRRTVSGTLTVTDREMGRKEKKHRPRPEFARMSEDRLCMLRWQAAIFGAGILLLFVAFIFSCTITLHNRCTRIKDDRSCSSSLSGLTSSSAYSSPSMYTPSPAPRPPAHRDPPRMYETPCLIR